MSIAEFLLGPFQLEAGTVERSKSGASRTAAFVLRHARASGDALSAISVSHATQMSNTLVLSGSKARIALDAPFIQARYATVAPVSFAAAGKFRGSFKSRVANSPYGQRLKRVGRMLFPGHTRISAPFSGSGLQFEIDEAGVCLLKGAKASRIMPPEATISVLEALDRLDGAQASTS